MPLPRAHVPVESAPPPAEPAGRRRRLPSRRALALVIGASVALWVPIILAARLLFR